MTAYTSATAPIRKTLLSGARLPLVAAAPIALGVSLVGGAARADEVLSTNRNTALYTSQSVIRITNTGSITDSGTGTDLNDLSTGLGIQSNAGWTFTNDGTIFITGNGQYMQANAVYAAQAGTITNNGLLSAPNAYAGVYFTSSGTNKALVTNNKTIIGYVSAVQAKSPIEIVNGSATDSNAVLKNTAPSTYPLSFAAVHLQSGFQPNTITNYGTIQGTTNAILSTGTVTITNHGTIVAASGHHAINLSGGLNSSVTLKDGSVLVGSIWSDPSLNSSLRLEGSGSLSDVITNVSSLTLDGTEWVLGGLGSTVTSTTIQSGILRLTGSLTGTVGINGGGTLAGTGTITGNVTTQSGGTLRPGGATTPGALTVTGNYTQMAGGTLTIQTTPLTSSTLTVNGNATLGGNLSVVPSGVGYGASTNYTILTTTGTLSGGFSSIASTDAGLTATANVDVPNRRVVLTLTTGGAPAPVVPNPPVVPNQPEVSPPPVVSPPPPPPPPVGVIDTSRPTFANDDGAVNATTVTFDGGTLRPTAPLTLAQPIQVTANSGTIDPNGGTITLSGGVGGTGTLTVAGPGNLHLSGVVSNTGGIAVQQGRITVGEGGIVAAPVTVASGGAVTVAEGGGVGGPVTVQGGSLTVAPNGIVNGAVALSNGGNANVEGAVMAPVTVSDGTVTVGRSGSVGALTVGEGGTARINGLALADVTIGQGATLSGGGTVAGPATLSGTLSPGNSPGVLTFRSPVTLTATNVFRAEIDGPTAGTGAGHHDQLRVEGAGFTAAGTLAPVLRGISGDAGNSFTPAIGQGFTVVTAEGGVAGRFVTLDQPSGGLATGTRLDVIYRADSVALAVTPRSYADLGAAGLGQTPNQRAVGEALETFRPAPNADAPGAVGALFNGLHGLSAGEIAPALNQLSGEIHADMMVAGRANRRLFGRAVEARQAASRGSAGPLGESSGAMLVDGKKAAVSGAPGPAATSSTHALGAHALSPHAMSVWGQPLVSWGRSASDGNGSTTNRRTGGFMVGGDYALDTELSAGVALGFLNSDVRASGGLGKGDLDSYQVTAYGSWRPGAAFLDAALGYGYSRYETARAASFGGLGGAASGKAGGHDLSAELSGGYRMAMDRVWFEPRAGLRWDRLQREGFTEEGGGPLTLREAEETENALRSSLGARFGTAFRFEDVTVEPAGTIAWEHDWLDTAGEATGSLNGARFTALSSRPGRDAAVVGAGVTVRMSERLAVQAGYLGEIRSRETNHNLSAGLRWSW